MAGLPTGVWGRQIDLALARAGKIYSFVRALDKDRFGQPVFQDMFGTPAPELTIPIRGIYHEEARWTNNLVSKEEGSNVNRYKTEAYILCKKEALTGLDWGMTVVVAEKTYRLVKARDIEALDMFCDLVLEEVEPHGLSNPV